MSKFCCEDVSTKLNSREAGKRTADGGPLPCRVARRCLHAAGCVVPGAILTLLPKCPACVAAYLAIGTGIGISLAAAIYLRIVIVVLCLASLSYFAALCGRRFMAR